MLIGTLAVLLFALSEGQFGPRDRCRAAGGQCGPMNACRGRSQPGLCAGPSAIRCCIPQQGSRAPSSGQKPRPDRCGPLGGQCGPASRCTGTLRGGLCPGGARTQCCLPVRQQPKAPSAPKPSPPTPPSNPGYAPRPAIPKESGKQPVAPSGPISWARNRVTQVFAHHAATVRGYLGRWKKANPTDTTPGFDEPGSKAQKDKASEGESRKRASASEDVGTRNVVPGHDESRARPRTIAQNVEQVSRPSQQGSPPSSSSDQVSRPSQQGSQPSSSSDQVSRPSQQGSQPSSDVVQPQGDGPRNKDGSLDMRRRENRVGGTNKDGSPDMRLKENRVPGFNKDGSPDMRYKRNRQAAQVPNGNGAAVTSADTGGSKPGTPDLVSAEGAPSKPTSAGPVKPQGPAITAVGPGSQGASNVDAVGSQPISRYEGPLPRAPPSSSEAGGAARLANGAAPADASVSRPASRIESVGSPRNKVNNAGSHGLGGKIAGRGVQAMQIANGCIDRTSAQCAGTVGVVATGEALNQVMMRQTVNTGGRAATGLMKAATNPYAALILEATSIAADRGLLPDSIKDEVGTTAKTALSVNPLNLAFDGTVQALHNGYHLSRAAFNPKLRANILDDIVKSNGESHNVVLNSYQAIGHGLGEALTKDGTWGQKFDAFAQGYVDNSKNNPLVQLSNKWDLGGKAYDAVEAVGDAWRGCSLTNDAKCQAGASNNALANGARATGRAISNGARNAGTYIKDTWNGWWN